MCFALVVSSPAPYRELVSSSYARSDELNSTSSMLSTELKSRGGEYYNTWYHPEECISFNVRVEKHGRITANVRHFDGKSFASVCTFDCPYDGMPVPAALSCTGTMTAQIRWERNAPDQLQIQTSDCVPGIVPQGAQDTGMMAGRACGADVYEWAQSNYAHDCLGKGHPLNG